jgi:hypothetical protein
VTRLIEVVKTKRNPEVRDTGAVLAGQSKHPRALKYIEEVLAR